MPVTELLERRSLTHEQELVLAGSSHVGSALQLRNIDKEAVAGTLIDHTTLQIAIIMKSCSNSEQLLFVLEVTHYSKQQLFIRLKCSTSTTEPTPRSMHGVHGQNKPRMFSSHQQPLSRTTRPSSPYSWC